MLLQEVQPARTLSSQSMLFLGLSNWTSTLLLDLSWNSMILDLSVYSTLLRDLSTWSKWTLNFSSFSALLTLYSWNFIFSVLSVLFLGLSLWSVLFLGISKQSTLPLDCSILSMLLLKLSLSDGAFCTVDMNFLRCRLYSGKSSKLQWFPPLSHKGSYFCWHSSHNCLPWEQSTTSSAVPWRKSMGTKPN